uniref:Variant surface glycoprotein 1637 n=1 Tax=Trypanosoma brucei TaxID=5691 RepID=M4T0M3_9TRYP|nr:variant surface glycoprotein 1637 [Trypanosoma brucei]
MWKKTAALIACLFLVMKHVPSAEEGIVNEEEFKTLCEFVSLAERINVSLEGMRGNPGVDATSLQQKVKSILFGAGISDVSHMEWGFHREMDCGRDSEDRRFLAGETLVKDLVCLCEVTGLQRPGKDLCYAGNARKFSLQEWPTVQKHRSTWDDSRNKCKMRHTEGLPTQTEFQEKRKRFETRIKGCQSSSGREYYTYGGDKTKTLSVCDGQESQTNGICVMYPKLPNQGSAGGIKWLTNLEDLVKTVEKMNKDETASRRTEPSTDAEPNMEKGPKPNTKRSTGENSPAKGTEGPQKDGNTNAQATTSTETGSTTTRPPEEQKSPAKMILQSIWMFFFLLFV